MSVSYQDRAHHMPRKQVSATALEGFMHYTVRLAESAPDEPYHCGTVGCEVCEAGAIALVAAERQPGEDG